MISMPRSEIAVHGEYSNMQKAEIEIYFASMQLMELYHRGEFNREDRALVSVRTTHLLRGSSITHIEHTTVPIGNRAALTEERIPYFMIDGLPVPNREPPKITITQDGVAVFVAETRDSSGKVRIWMRGGKWMGLFSLEHKAPVAYGPVPPRSDIGVL